MPSLFCGAYPIHTRNDSLISFKKKNDIYITSAAGGPDFVLVHGGRLLEPHHAGVDPSSRHLAAV